MNFLAPEMLLGLLLVPVAIGFYLWAQRRRSKYAVRFTNLDLLANLTPRRPSWRRHLPPVLYLVAIAALLDRPGPPDDGLRQAARGRDRRPGHGRLGFDARDRRLADPARCRQGLGPLVHRSAPRGHPRRDRLVRVGARHARQPDRRPKAAQGRHRRADRPRRDGHGRRADAGPRHRREDPGGQRRDPGRQRLSEPRGDTRCIGRPRRQRPAERADRRAVGPAARRRHPPVRRGAVGRQGRSRSRRPSAPRPSAFRSTRSPSARPTARSRSRTTSARWSRSTCRPTPRRWQQIASITGATNFTAPTAADLASVYANLESRIGYTEERQEVTFALVGAGLLLVVLGAGLSAVWFGRLP